MYVLLTALAEIVCSARLRLVIFGHPQSLGNKSPAGTFVMTVIDYWMESTKQRLPRTPVSLLQSGWLHFNRVTLFKLFPEPSFKLVLTMYSKLVLKSGSRSSRNYQLQERCMLKKLRDVQTIKD